MGRTGGPVWLCMGVDEQEGLVVRREGEDIVIVFWGVDGVWTREGQDWGRV